MKAGSDLYRDWHWGIPPKHRIKWDDPELDAHLLQHNPDAELVECGRLVEMHVREPGNRSDTIIRLNRKEGNGSHLAFDPFHPYQRLYILAHPDLQARLTQTYRANPEYKGGSKYRSMPLSEIANRAGGRHGTRDYLGISASPLGVLTHVVYATEKKGDGYSQYIHKLGEESGIRPILAVDGVGRPWVVGGNYTSPTPGITD
jgi:hypothetical protein